MHNTGSFSCPTRIWEVSCCKSCYTLSKTKFRKTITNKKNTIRSGNTQNFAPIFPLRGSPSSPRSYITQKSGWWFLFWPRIEIRWRAIRFNTQKSEAAVSNPEVRFDSEISTEQAEFRCWISSRISQEPSQLHRLASHLQDSETTHRTNNKKSYITLCYLKKSRNGG